MGMVGSCSRARVWQRIAALAMFVVAGVMGGAVPVVAQTAFSVTSNNDINRFNTSLTPVLGIPGRKIRGLQPGETVLAIDLRPSTGQLYLLGSTSRLYVLNADNGEAVSVGAPFSPALVGGRFEIDFHPVLDSIRLISDLGQNLELDPDSGRVTSVLPDISSEFLGVVALAYSDNVPEGTMTRLFAIDSGTDQLLTATESGFQSEGPLGIDIGSSDLVGFDIAANDDAAYAAVTGASTTLYRVDLSTGAASLVGRIAGPLVGLTLAARAVPLLALRNGTDLVRFLSARPETVLSTTAVRGLQPGETLLGIDWGQNDGLLYGVGSTRRVYVVDPMSGAATPIGPPFDIPLSGTKFGVDGIGDGLRVVSDTGLHLGINLSTGAASLLEQFSPGSAEIAFLHPYHPCDVNLDVLERLACRGPYRIDVVSDRLVIGSSGFSVGPLGVDTSAAIGFDISPFDNAGFAVLTVGGVPSLYGIDLQSGAATLLGAVGGTGTITGLTAVPLTFSFAEGSSGAFFDTDLLLANPGPTVVPAIITYFTPDGRVITQRQSLGPTSRTTVSADANDQLGATAFAATVSSPTGVPIVVERTMRWDASGYGMHTEHGVNPSPTWFFAEGSQGFFQTYFLLTNPSTETIYAEVTFLMENGGVVPRTYPLPPQSRRTVYAGDVLELVNRSFGTSVHFWFGSGVAERAMYFGSPVFNAGHESAGIARPATDWFLAEGATGSFFTTFVLLLNPSEADANVTLTYLREGGGTVTRTLVLPASSRRTINVALEDASLAATSVATRVTSDVPIVAERSMYWPFDPASWQEAHNAFGVTQTAHRWGLAEGRVGGEAAFQTFVLVANPGTTAANLTVAFLRTSGTTVTKTLTVAAGARLTITTGPGSMVPELADEAFGTVVTSDQPVFVERAMYSNASTVFWAAGSAATASPLP
jgi:hypothetical protein